MGFKFRRLPSKRRFLLLLALAIGLSIAIAQPGLAQFSLPSSTGQGSFVGPPAAVTRYGNIETMPVRSPLSNRVLFTIAAPTVNNRNPDALGEKQTVESRVREIQAKMLLLLQREMDPESLMFGVSRLNNVTIISARDAQYSRPLVLASVTDQDADFNGLPIDELAEQWRDLLEADLRNGIAKLPKDRQRVRQIIVGLVLITLLVLALKYALSKPQRRLRQQQQDNDIATTADVSHLPPEDKPTTLREQVEHRRITLLQKLQQGFTLERQRAALDLSQWLLFWLLVLAWYGGAVWIFTVSPYLLINSLGLFESLLKLLTIWFVTGLAIRISRRLIDYFSVAREGLDIGDFLTMGDSQRRQIRTSTIAAAIKGFVTILIIIIGCLTALAALGLPTASVVAIGSLAGLAITFGSQNLIKDLVNGFFILAEDQYAIGDVINVNTAEGLVENLNMRVTQLRSGDGELVTIPNSAITQVKNMTRSWSRVAFSIDVAYHTSPAKALQVLRDVAQEFYDAPEWHGKMLAPPNVLGIDDLSHSGIRITTWIQTAPAQQWAVGREFRLRVRDALEVNGIEIGVPKQVYEMVRPTSEQNGLTQEPAN